MDIIKIIKETYPELEGKDYETKLLVQDDCDGQGAYIAKWEYSKPIPEGLKLGK
jgi:XkdW protein